MSILKNWGLLFFYWLARRLVSLRYRVEIKGLEKIVQSKEKGILFLPNHVAEVDPLILISTIFLRFKPHPLVVDYFYYQKGLRFFMDLVGAFPLPAMDFVNQWKLQRLEKLKNRVVEKLKEGENFLIYPSGKLKINAEERLGGNFLVPEIIASHPKAKIVLVRITGLWGSLFSKAITGSSPDFGKVLWKGCKIILKNGIFFAPKRPVQVEFEFAPENFPYQQPKMEINKWLENWYNQKGAEPLQLISFAFWKKEFPVITAKQQGINKEEVPISNEIREQIIDQLSKTTHWSKEAITPDLHLSNDLGLDSIDVAGLQILLEERFAVTGVPLGQLQTVKDLFQIAAGSKKEGEGSPPSEKKQKWPKESSRLPPLLPPGKTVQEVFLHTCDRMGNAIACADAISGVVTYRKLKLAALVLSLKIREMPGENIGILLPSSVGSYVTILATLLAGKIPVMLNWTAGVRSIEHVRATCSLQTVLSSYRFLSRLNNAEIGPIDDLLLFLEEVRGNISLKTKLKGWWLSFRKAETLLSKLPKASQDYAVILFTSGTESLPKGVPLTHQNILWDQQATLSCVQLFPTDIIYGVLPPFHSFGFSLTGLLPLLMGLKACYAPDPTNSHALASDIEHWQPTMFCCAPSFVQSVLHVAKEGQLKSLRMIVMGAEKVPNELFDLLSSKGVIVLEGYGISECGPVVTLDRENEPHKGVGKPIPGVELCVIDSDTQKLLPQGKEGEICICGPNVFGGYWGIPKDPFIQIEGKKWYRSGDRGYLEGEGTLILTGRLKRFVKIGGEMVSLGGIEEDLLLICQKKGWGPKIEGPILAVTARGRESDKAEIIVFSVFDLDREALNQALKEMGEGRLAKIAEIRKIQEIPRTGVGKINYRSLDEIVEKS